MCTVHRAGSHRTLRYRECNPLTKLRCYIHVLTYMNICQYKACNPQVRMSAALFPCCFAMHLETVVVLDGMYSSISTSTFGFNITILTPATANSAARCIPSTTVYSVLSLLGLCTPISTNEGSSCFEWVVLHHHIKLLYLTRYIWTINLSPLHVSLDKTKMWCVMHWNQGIYYAVTCSCTAPMLQATSCWWYRCGIGNQ